MQHDPGRPYAPGTLFTTARNYRGAWCAGAGLCGCVSGVEFPLRATDEPRAAAVKIPTVATFIRRGVSQLVCRAWSHERVPLAPAIAAMAHTAHTGKP